MKRAFLVPVGVAAAALTAKAGATDLAALTPDAAGGDGSNLNPMFAPTARTLMAVSPNSALSPLSLQATTRVRADLTVRQMVPDPRVHGVGAKGTLTGTLKGRMLYWHLAFVHLSGPATFAQLHKGRRGENGAKIAKLCGPCHSPKTGVLVLSPSQVIEVLAGRTYVRVATHKAAHGEIRGQLHRVVPLGIAAAPLPPIGGHASHVSHYSHYSHRSHISGSGHYSHSSHSSHSSHYSSS